MKKIFSIIVLILCMLPVSAYAEDVLYTCGMDPESFNGMTVENLDIQLAGCDQNLISAEGVAYTSVTFQNLNVTGTVRYQDTDEGTDPHLISFYNSTIHAMDMTCGKNRECILFLETDSFINTLKVNPTGTENGRIHLRGGFRPGLFDNLPFAKYAADDPYHEFEELEGTVAVNTSMIRELTYTSENDNSAVLLDNVFISELHMEDNAQFIQMHGLTTIGYLFIGSDLKLENIGRVSEKEPKSAIIYTPKVWAMVADGEKNDIRIENDGVDVDKLFFLGKESDTAYNTLSLTSGMKFGLPNYEIVTVMGGNVSLTNTNVRNLFLVDQDDAAKENLTGAIAEIYSNYYAGPDEFDRYFIFNYNYDYYAQELLREFSVQSAPNGVKVTAIPNLAIGTDSESDQSAVTYLVISDAYCSAEKGEIQKDVSDIFGGWFKFTADDQTMEHVRNILLVKQDYDELLPLKISK